MKLKDRLFTAFFILIAMPVILLSISAYTIISLQMNSIQKSYDVEGETVQLITNPIQIFNRLTRGPYNEIKLALLKSPEKLEDETFINDLNDELINKYSFILVRKDDKFTFVGDKEKFYKIKASLQEFGKNNTDVDGGTFVGGRNPFLIKAQDFYFADGGRGTVFVITDLNTLVPQLKSLIFQSVISFITVLCITAAILMIWIYRSILSPLNKLRKGMNRIKEGDLDYSVKTDTDDEIGQLCEDFEEMRIRLKDLINSRLAYEEEIRELISNISHDLKTPLTAIKGYAEGLIDGVADTQQKQEKYLKTIMTKANDMSILVDELSFYAKIDCNTIPYSFKAINVSDYFNDCLEELNFDFEIKNIELEYVNETAPDTMVVADAEQLKRVINNIISNSIKYRDKNKDKEKISIHIKDTGTFVQIEIGDNGIGISQMDLPYIFERFYRADASRNSRKGGSGLGLAIAKKIIEDHAGEIWAESEIGVGTTIFFTLKKYDKKEA